jgi:hypothetical protein
MSLFCALAKSFTEILYLKFKLSNEKTAFVPRDNVIFYGISLKFMISQCSVRYYNIPRNPTADPPWDIIVSHAHAWRVDTTLWNNMAAVRELLYLFVISYRRFDLTNKIFEM